jgi:hypothetical protein
VRLLHLAQELAGVGRQRLDVAALALGVEGVEGQRRLARAGHAGEDHQLPLGDGQLVDAQVVLAGAAHDDEIWLVSAAGDGHRAVGRATHGQEP